MTQDEIIQMLHKVVAENQNFTTWTVSTPHLVGLVNAAIAKEREACAKACEQSEIPIPIDVWHGGTKKEMTKHTALALAKAIRAREEQA